MRRNRNETTFQSDPADSNRDSSTATTSLNLRRRRSLKKVCLLYITVVDLSILKLKFYFYRPNRKFQFTSLDLNNDIKR